VVYMGRALAEFRAEKKLSSEEMAYTLGVAQATYSKYENDKLPVPLQIIILITKNYRAVQMLGKWYGELMNMVVIEMMPA
jgi:transcriptional regulator with XRE-family HTH domain